MKVVILMENSTCRDTVACAHGLSMYIETDKHKILFDMGPDAQFIDNAKALGVDLTQVDIAFLSHAHNDHCGGLEAFLKLNDRAKVYMQKAVWGQYYVVTPSKCAYIGMDAVLKNYEDRFVLCDGVQKLDEELTVFSAVPGRELWSGANDTLREKIGEDYPRDTFRHEQDLLVTENGKTALFAGCAHCGIVNILKSAEDVLGRAPDAVFAGFHLYNPSLGKSEPGDFVSPDGQVCGRHKGLLHYTVGQRKHLGVALGYPVFIKEIDPEQNRIYLARTGEEYAGGVLLTDCVIQPNPWLNAGQKTAHVLVKVRSRAPDAPATVTLLGDGRAQVVFDAPQRAPAPGQSCVIYRDAAVLGGGFIQRQI